MAHKKLKILAWFVILSFAVPPGFAQDVLSEGQIPRAFEKAIKDFHDPFKEKITLDYKDADIAAVLRSLSYTYGLNLVTSTEVKGKVTISLKDVPLGEALEAILSANGYNYSIKGDIIYITPGTEEGAQLSTEPITLKYLKAGDAQNLIRKVLSPKGDIKVDDVFNLLVVTDYPANIEKLKELLKSVDRPPQQVLIEAKIVDITSKDLQNIGLTWSVDYNPGKGIFGRKTAAEERLKTTGTIPGPSSNLSGGQIVVDTLILKGLSATATLDALIQDQKANLLASPSIAVLNNREARIIIGEKVPYKERSQTTTGTTETTKFIDVGTTLRVTPSINADGYITMNIHPEVSSVNALLDAGPRITTREADTQVRVREGETIVIGGLIKQEDNRTQSRMPLLGYIPIAGYLFGNRSKDKTQTELAVFITPKILRSRAEMAEEGKNPYQEEAYVNIMATGKLNAQMVLFEKARNLDTDTELEARDKEEWMRKRQALSIYETIFTQFPDGPKAPESGYYAARIYFKDLKEVQRARELCSQILSAYPNSPFFDKTKELYIKTNIYMAKQGLKRKQKEKEIQKAKEIIRARAVQQAEDQAKDKLKEMAKISEKIKTWDLQELKLLEQEKAERVREQMRFKAEDEKRAQQEKIERQRLEKELNAKKALESRRQQEEKALQAKKEREEKAKQEKLQKEQLRKDQEQKTAQAREEARLKAEQSRKEAEEKAKQEKLQKEQELKTAQEARLKAEEEARQARLKAQDEARQARKQQEELKRKELEAARQEKLKNDEIRRQTEIEAKNIREQVKQKEREEALVAREQAMLRAEQERKLAKEARLKAEEDARQARLKSAENARLAKDESRRQAEEANRKAEEARLQTAQAKKEADEKLRQEKLQKEQELKSAQEAKKQAEEQAKELRKQEEEKARLAREQAKLQAEQERKIAQEARLKAAEEARLQTAQAKKEADEKLRQEKLQKEQELKSAQEARLKAEEAARQAKKQAEVQARLKADEEARQARVEREQARAQVEIERKRQEEKVKLEKIKKEEIKRQIKKEQEEKVRQIKEEAKRQTEEIQRQAEEKAQQALDEAGASR